MACTNPPTTTVHIDARRPFAAFELPDNKKFTGKKHLAVGLNPCIVLRFTKVLDLIHREA